jgi:hypothetical protein
MSISLPSVFIRSNQEESGVRTTKVILDEPLFLPNDMACVLKMHTCTIPYTFATVFDETMVPNRPNNHIQISPDGGMTIIDLYLKPGLYANSEWVDNGLTRWMDDQVPPWGVVSGWPVRFDSNLTEQRVFAILDSSLLNPAVGAGPIQIQLNPLRVGSLTIRDGPAQLMGWTPWDQPNFAAPVLVAPLPDLTVIAPFEPQFGNHWAAGVSVLGEGDISGIAVQQGTKYSPQIGQVMLTSQSIPSDVLNFPLGGQQPVPIPLYQGKTIKEILIRFVSSASGEDLWFMAGNCSIILTFEAHQ